MPLQRNDHYRAIPYAHANYNRLCRKHKVIPTPADVDAIRRVIGPLSTLKTDKDHFEAALLFFLPRTDVRFEQGSLLIGWLYDEDFQTKHESWYKPSKDASPLYLGPGGVRPRGGKACDEWHPVISEIVDPDEDKNGIVQYAYIEACIKLLQAAVPPPSIERSRSAPIDLATTRLAALVPNVQHQENTIIPQVLAAPSGRRTSSAVDLTGSDEEVVIKPEVTSASVDHIQAPDIRLEEKIQAFRDKLDKQEVEELQQMLEKQLPSWIMKLAKDVLRKKMLKELDLAESYLP